MARPARWRLQRDRRRGGVYYTLVRGKKNPTYLGLGADLTEEQAQRCVETMRREDEELRGTPQFDRVVRLVQARREDPHLGEADRKAAILCLLHGFRATDAFNERFGEPEPEYGRLTLREYWTDVFWPVRTGEREERNAPTVAESTIRADRNRWKHINDAIGDVRLDDLDAWVFEGYLDGMNQSGRTKALHRSAYQALLRYAHRKGHIREAHAFFPIRGATTSTAEKEDPLTPLEIAKLLTTATSPMRRFMWALGVGQGLRPSELVRVRWEDFDLEASTMWVRGDPEQGGRGKTEASVAEIPLTPFTASEFRRYWAKSGEPPSGLMFTWRGEPIGNFKKALKEAARRAKLGRRVHPYLLRHSFATMAYNLGVPKDVTRRIGRWTDFKMLDDVYCRPRARDLVEKLSGFDIDVEALAGKD